MAVALVASSCARQEPPTPSSTAGHSTGEPVVNFANFVEEIAPETLPAFTRETGLAVNYDTYETNLSLESKLFVGSTGYDVVVPGNNFLERQIVAGVYQPLDKTKLPNWKHLDVEILRQLAVNDPGNQYAVPYLWGTTAFGYDVRRVEAALGGPAPDSWALLFDPKYASKLASCGIALPDTPWLMFGFALMYLGRDPNSERPEDLAAALDLLMRIRPYVRDVTAGLVSTQLVDGDYCFVVGTNADLRLAREVAEQAGRDIEFRYVIPQEGATLWIDVLAIPKDAPHPQNAHQLIDHLMRPEVIAGVTRSIYYPNANQAGTGLLPAEVRNDPMIYPDAAALGRLRMNAALSDETTRVQNRGFIRFKAGQ